MIERMRELITNAIQHHEERTEYTAFKFSEALTPADRVYYRSENARHRGAVEALNEMLLNLEVIEAESGKED